MSDWKTYPLSELCEIRPAKGESKERLKETDSVSFVPMKDLPIDVKYLAAIQAKPLKKLYSGYTYFADNDVLLAKITPCFQNGKLSIAKDLTNGIGFGSSEFIVFRPCEELDNEFLYYFLSRTTFREEGVAQMSGAVGHQRVPKDFIEEYPTPLPPLAEQKRIVSILDEAFSAIAKAKENAEKNLANARELFESYLNRVFTQQGPGWQEKKLVDVCHKVTVGHVGSMKERYVSEGVPMLRSQNIRPFNVTLKNVVFINDEFHAELKKSALEPGDLAIVRTGYPGTAAVVPDSLPKSNCSDLVIVKCDEDRANAHYLALFFNSEYGKRMVSGNLTGAAQKHFNVTAAKKVLIPFAPLEKQQTFVDECLAFRRKAERLETIYTQKLANLDELKQSLLQKAFTGQLTAFVKEDSVIC